MEKESCFPPAAKPPIFERRRSFRDIQRVVSKMNPEVLKSVINNKSSLPAVCDPTLRLSSGYEKNIENAPMTIFYNGKVAVFHVSPYQAQEIMKVAEEGVVLPNCTAESSESNSYDLENFLENLYRDLPLARRKSLKRFLEKRKERLTMMSPYE